MSKKASLKHFEQSLSELEDLVKNLENGQLTLAESLEQFEQGIKLTQDCQQALTEAEQKVKILLKKQNETKLTAYKSDNSQ